MKALITGASSGIGKDMAKYLSHLGYDLVIVARRTELLEQLQAELQTKVEIVTLDISKKENCLQLFANHKDIDILVNNAGFGLFGHFTQTDLEQELNMMDTNMKAVHILTKLYLQEMVQKDQGYILNVASIAGFIPGPLMATYYATKNYIVALSRAIQKELKKQKSNVHVSVLCPGPVNTEFNYVAGVQFALKGLSSDYVAKYAIDQLLKRKKVIIPGITVKLGKIATKIFPDALCIETAYHIQKSKNQKTEKNL